MEPIDISSDSDFDIDFEGFDGQQDIFLNNERVLPDWAASSSAGYATQDISVDGIGVHGKPEMEENSVGWNSNQPTFSDNIKTIDSKKVNLNDSYWYGSQEHLGHSRGGTVNLSGTDYQTFFPQQASKRVLPSSVHYATYDSETNMSNGGRNIQIHSSQRPMQCSTGLSLSHKYESNNDDLFIYESNGNRILPQSLANGSALASSSSFTSDAHFRTDDRVAENNERLIYRAALQDLLQPNSECDVPSGLLSVSLLKHQRIALQWMLQKETRSLHCCGGILADDQGLGKTVSMISLVMTQKYAEVASKSEQKNCQKVEPLNLDEDDNFTTVAENHSKFCDTQDSTFATTFSCRKPAGTLVVCPASVLRQWARELDEKVAPESKLNVLVYHGASRTKDHAELAKYDVVLTTYAIVTNEVPKKILTEGEDTDGLGSEFSNSKKQKLINGTTKRKRSKKGFEFPEMDNISGALAKVVWMRVVLDEAQTIKNYRTQVARACCSLRAKKRWCLSGTPIQNTIDDLYSYFRFLRYEPYNVYKQFHSAIKVPIYKSSPNGYKKLQVVLRSVLLRRTKETFIHGEPIITLPPKTIFLKKAEFFTKERSFYTWLETESRSKFKAFAAAGTVKQNYANILLMLLRLRQACDHPMLVKGSISGSAGKLSQELVENLPSDMVANLLNHLADSSAICVVCNDPPEDSVVTLCGHVFCYQCVSDYLIGDENTCPAPGCKEHLGSDNVFSEKALQNYGALAQDSAGSGSQFDEESVVCRRDYVSSKVNAILETLHVTTNRTEDSAKESTKSIIFSQWTGMLDLVEHSLKKHLVNLRRLDGTMSLAARDKAVKDFNTDPEVTVMLMSLKAGNLGLNMVAASHVIILDLWWNPTTEDQAIDRAHRIGQTRPVTVTRLTVKDTVEDRILALQEEKRKMVASAFGEDKGGTSASRLTVEDLRYLFNVDP